MKKTLLIILSFSISYGLSAEWTIVQIYPIPEAGDNLIPMVTKLNRNYPNPFNSITKISFDLAEKTEVHLQVFNT
jgi:hypothetical protein